MLDLHCHILPGVDDGADTPDTACRMAAMAADCGVEVIVATPHCNNPGLEPNFASPGLHRQFARLQAELDRWGIPVQILPGAEVLVRSSFAADLEAGRYQTLAGSRYLLVEFWFDTDPHSIDRALDTVLQTGLVPVLAHPERYFCVQDRPSLASAWADRGCVLQLNKGSILGSLGAGAYDAASLLLARGLCHIIASDAHHYRYRSTDLSGLVAAMERRFPGLDPFVFLQRNPLRIINDRPL